MTAIRAAAAAAAAFLGVAAPALGVAEPAAAPAAVAQVVPAPPPAAASARAIPDIEVRDQDGRRWSFASDLLRGRTAVISFIYTSCTATCPLVGRVFAELQEALVQAGRDDVVLLSLSRDPETDTPERLAQWGRRFGARPDARPGWLLLSADKVTMDDLLLALTGDPARRGAHSAAVLILDVDRGIWRRESGLAPTADYLGILDQVRPPAPAASRR
jgi:protein SCO1